MLIDIMGITFEVKEVEVIDEAAEGIVNGEIVYSPTP